MIPASHVVLFFSMPWPIALAALALSIAVTQPLAYLFELGGRTIWAPAILHVVMQGAIKVVQLPPDEGAGLPIIWMAACAAVSYVVFFVKADRRRSSGVLN